MILRRSNNHGNSASMITFLILCILYPSTSLAFPFFSSSSQPTAQEEIDQWIASPATVTHLDLHPSPPPTDSKSQDIKDRILILTPLKDAAAHLPNHFSLLSNLTYPHHLIDLGFIIGDTTDDTASILDLELDRLSRHQTTTASFRSATIVHKDLGDFRSQDVAARHGFQAQVKRRQKLAIVRNALLKESMREEYDWVFWRDVDVEESPEGILEDFVGHGRDVVVPSKLLFPLILGFLWGFHFS